MKRRLLLFVFLALCLLAPAESFAHSGGTDYKGGHYDHSTGQYHYHHGYSAHQHPNGVCPYEKKANVTKGTTYSGNSVTKPTATPKRVFNTVFYLKTATPQPTAKLKAYTLSSTPTPTSKLRPAVTVAPSNMVTATPRPTVKATSTPRLTATPRLTSSPTQRPAVSSTTPIAASDEMSHVRNYFLLVGIALISVCVAVHASRARKRERENAAADHNLQIEIAKAETKKAAEKELRLAYVEISSLEQKLADSSRYIEQQTYQHNTAENLHAQAAAVAKQEAERQLLHANTKISQLEQKQRESQKRIEDLTAELKKAKEVSTTPQLMYVPPVPDPFPEVGDLPTFYSTHYPTTWAHIQRYALNEFSYLNYYHYIWGNLQIHHGDGLVHGKLTDAQRARINFPDPGPSIFIGSMDSIHYHNTPNCYTLLGSQYVTYSRSCASRYVPCTKCVKQ